jgi:hypothetical protein
VLVTVNEHEKRAVHDAFLEATGAEGVPISLDGGLYHNLGRIDGTAVYHDLSQAGPAELWACWQTLDKVIRSLDLGTEIAVGIASG